ncbi:MAG TPA: mannose-1-phosphate guanylyltransferase/mannose-6-phosphate isomerase [Crenotrichaceae bacterium]|nr:mannose-1-phosphate guanylyltransferase/mannose-6-phosphate isomerase [Crenotrichaceae bacterium]
MSIQSVILSGGSGTRLWPYSRQALPKQFLPLVGDRTLLQETALRIDGLKSYSNELEILPTVVVSNESHRFLVADQLAELGYQDSTIILESSGRNTAPALTIAAQLALSRGDDPVLIVMPSDHIIEDVEGFQSLLMHAAELADKGRLVTFGIVPDKPETGFGYLLKGRAIDDQAFELSQFVEKPDLETAKTYLASGNYLWNSGIFVVKASVWIDQITQLQPAIATACNKAVQQGQTDGVFFRVDAENFDQSPSDSIDYAVMEKLSVADSKQLSVVIPMDVAWSDLGSWTALAGTCVADPDDNVTQGDVVMKQAQNNAVFAQERLVAVVGVDDLVIVETRDAVLVSHKDNVQDVKSITEHLHSTGRSEHVFHSKVHRPWGYFESIDTGERYQVKRLTVKPGASLSLQMHHHRAEHWVVVSGTAKVTRGEETFLISENESTYIPIGVQHRLENPGKVRLEIIEVQSGSYLDEDDIVRFEDSYNRIDT